MASIPSYVWCAQVGANISLCYEALVYFAHYEPSGSARFPTPPPVPPARSVKVISIKEDPKLRGTYRYRVQISPDRDGFETAYILEFLAQYPDKMRALGFERLADGTIEYPDVNGLNARLRTLYGSSTPPLLARPDPYRDGLTHYDFVRNWGEGYLSVSLSGRSEENSGIHFHDMFTHLMGYLLLPPDVVHQSRQYAQFLVELHDRFLELREPFTSRNLTDFSRTVDRATADIARMTILQDQRNLNFPLSHLQYSVSELIQMLSSHRDRLGFWRRRQLDAFIDGWQSDPNHNRFIPPNNGVQYIFNWLRSDGRPDLR